jgi:hypothetical protein
MPGGALAEGASAGFAAGLEVASFGDAGSAASPDPASGDDLPAHPAADARMLAAAPAAAVCRKFASIHSILALCAVIRRQLFSWRFSWGRWIGSVRYMRRPHAFSTLRSRAE